MKEILVGIGMTEQSSVVLKYALKLAQHFMARLTVVHIIEHETPALSVGKKTEWQTVQQVYLDKRKTEVQTFVSQHIGKQYQAIDIDIEVKIGQSYEELVKIQQEKTADLMILGKFTKTGRLFGADTSDQIIGITSCPILLVPEDALPEYIERIVYAAELTPEDVAPIQFLSKFVKAFEGELICLHVSKNDAAYVKDKKILSALETQVNDSNVSFDFIIGAVEESIEKYAALSQTDILAILHRDRDFLSSIFRSSITKSISKHTEIPMIVFH